MRRLLSVLVIVASVGLMLPGTVAAAKLVGCTNSMTPIALNVGWVPADGIPARGEDPWWDNTVDGLAAEGLTVLEGAGLFGQTTELEFYAFINAGVLTVDVNGNGTICYKKVPQQQNGTELYFFLATDDKVR